MRTMTSVWSIIPLLICAMLIGHDVLMTGDPHAGADTRASHHAEESEQTADCHLPEAARTTLLESDPIPPPATLRPQSEPLSTLPALPSWERAPGHPPDQLRAMLQVFLN